MKKYEIDFQLAPPHMHRLNAAERAIRTFKNYFISGFSSTYPDLPISKWDRLISQCVVTLDLLRNFQGKPSSLSICLPFWTI